MPRPAGKATKIAYAILGKPANMTKARQRRPKSQLKTPQEVRFTY